MKYSLYIIVLILVFILVFTVSTKAQEQVIPDPYLTVVKKGGIITISQSGEEYSFIGSFDEESILVRKKGKYLLYNTWQPGEIFIPVKFNEIVLLATHTEGIVYKMRKGKKWGAGDCETYETEIAYDEIDCLVGECTNNYFRVEVDGEISILEIEYWIPNPRVLGRQVRNDNPASS